jgi:Flp pilus assembly pilin Flp
MRQPWLGIGRKLERGQTTTEYALIMALVVVVGLVTWANWAPQLLHKLTALLPVCRDLWNEAKNSIGG